MKLPMSGPALAELLKMYDVSELYPKLVGITPAPAGRYFHWDKLRHRTPPRGLTVEEWWLGIKLARAGLLKPITLLDKAGRPFKYGLPDSILRMLHEVDKDAAGGIQMPEVVTNPNSRDRYIINSLIEESVTSSQLEGASTTTDVAKDMIRSGRKPIDRSEHMIFNNYRAMRFVQAHSKDQLTPDLVFELHRIVTADTLDEPTKAGRFRSPTDNIVVEDPSGHILHVPPAATELPARLDAMCAFANERPTDVFLHPVIRAIILHFWIGYNHPFVDGNGRTARALFYWSMLSQNYWLAEFLSISQILRRAPAQYSRSFVYTETDENDLTYFILHQLRVISRAIDELQDYLSRKMQEVREVHTLRKQTGDLNHRQLALLSHALRHPGMNYTIQSHRTSHNVVYQTARTDLLDLAVRGLLIQRKTGKAYAFVAPHNLGDRLSASAQQGAAGRAGGPPWAGGPGPAGAFGV